MLIKAGDSMAMVDIEVINDTETEDNETVTLTVVSASTPGNADIVPDVDMDTDDVIIKDDGDGLFVHVMKQQDGSEPGFDDADDGLFKIFLTDANGDPAVVPAGSTLSGFLQIKYTIGKPGDTATEGADFKSLADTVSIAEGASSALVSIEVLDDNEIEGTEFISIKIDDVQDSDGTPITTLGTGEEIGIDSAWMMDSLDILDDDSSFEVTSVKVGSSSWTSTFNSVVDPVDGQGYAIPTGGTVQNDTVSWVDIDTIYVSFNDDIDVATMVPANFVLHGLQGASTPSVMAVTWDAGTKTARLSLSGAIINDKLRVEVKDAVKNTCGEPLNGEFVNDSDSLPGTGDDFTGGDFNFTFNVLPGDATHSTTPATARTNVGDAALVYGSLAAFPFGYPTTTASMFYDVNGNGVVNVGDAAAIFGLLSGSPFGFGLPVGSPGEFAGGSFSLSTGILLDNGVQSDWSQPQDERSVVQGSRTSGDSTIDRSLAGSIVDDGVNSSLDSVFGDELNRYLTAPQTSEDVEFVVSGSDPDWDSLSDASTSRDFEFLLIDRDQNRYDEFFENEFLLIKDPFGSFE